MRMCYLSISHTNVFSVTVPPRRLQEGSGALIKGAFAGQECGLLHPGVTGAGCLLGRASAQMASRGLRSVAAEPRCNEAFPLHRCASSEPPAPPLARAHTHKVTTQHCTHTSVPFLSRFCCPLPLFFSPFFFPPSGPQLPSGSRGSEKSHRSSLSWARARAPS